MEGAVERGSFREDLFYRLNVTPLHLPAVRERTPEDRIALLHALLDELRQDIPRGPARIADDAVERLVAYPWPGNIREMRNVLERALIFGAGSDELRRDHLPAELRRSAGRAAGGGGFRPESMQDVERRHIERMLLHHDGNRTRAARDLGMARATLINKIKLYALDL